MKKRARRRVTMFFTCEDKVYAVVLAKPATEKVIAILAETLGTDAYYDSIRRPCIGPRRAMVTSWSTNAVSAIQLKDVMRVEEFTVCTPDSTDFDPMLQEYYPELTQDTFRISKTKKKVMSVRDVVAFNKKHGLSFSPSTIHYLRQVREKYGRPLTDVEVFSFAQANSDHCRHNKWNARVIIDGVEQKDTLFELTKMTYYVNHGKVVSAFGDNAAAFGGRKQLVMNIDTDHFISYVSEMLISILKMETHNHPSWISAYPGAATCVGGEIRDRLAVGCGSEPIYGVAAYFVPLLRLYSDGPIPAKNWKYQNPVEMLIRASDGFSNYGNEFGQPAIGGLTVEGEVKIGDQVYGYHKPVIAGGGIGNVYKRNLHKHPPKKGEIIVLLGGPNYLIGLNGGAGSSAAGGENSRDVELASVQRGDGEMENKVAKVLWFITQEGLSHGTYDHGAGGHGNCLAELVEPAGGIVYKNRLPLGDETLSDMEIWSNESQERMAFRCDPKDWPRIQEICAREQCPVYNIGTITGDGRFVLVEEETGEKPFDMELADIIGNPPQMVIEDTTVTLDLEPLDHCADPLGRLVDVLHLVQVGNKGFEVNKVDSTVGGRTAQQQRVGSLHIPLNDYQLATSSLLGFGGTVSGLGVAAFPALIDPEAGSRLAIVRAVIKALGVVIDGGLGGITLSVNWMWPTGPGEFARIYKAVDAISRACIELGINVSTGKDSMSMTVDYGNGEIVLSPGTAVVFAAGGVEDVRRRVTPVLRKVSGSKLIRVDMSNTPLELGGSSFALATGNGSIGDRAPDVDLGYFKKVVPVIQELLSKDKIIAMHHVGSGGLITALLEMVFAGGNTFGIDVSFDNFGEEDLSKVLYAENPSVVMQVRGDAIKMLAKQGVKFELLSEGVGTKAEATISLTRLGEDVGTLDANEQLQVWSETSLRLEERQTSAQCVKQMRESLGKQPLTFDFEKKEYPKLADLAAQGNKRSGVIAAVIREEGTNGHLEMINALKLGGFDVKDVHMTDLKSGRETLEDVQFIVFAGGFSYADVLGSAVGWKNSFKRSRKARKALKNFLAREDTMSLGVCNGCQLMAELGYLTANDGSKFKMVKNDSGRFESHFVNVEIHQGAIMLDGLAGSRLGAWVAHGQGKFRFDGDISQYNVVMNYSYQAYPGNPNGSPYGVAAVASKDGRHLAMMPHPERSLHPHGWAYGLDGSDQDFTPWYEMFVAAFQWCLQQQQQQQEEKTCKAA